MTYDPTETALFHPEQQERVEFPLPWPCDAKLAEFARLAYVPFENGPVQQKLVTDAMREFGYAATRFFCDTRDPSRYRLSGTAFGAVSCNSDEAIIAFRGTRPDSFKDLVTDAYFVPTKWKGTGLVHSGFWLALKNIWPEIDAWLDSIKCRKLVLTGHSLGAALATLLADLKPSAELVTFGSPLVGNAMFAAAFKGRSVRRYVDCTDIITHVPPPPYFVHLDGLRYIDRNGVVHNLTESEISLAVDHKKAAADYWQLIWQPGNVHLRNLADHAPRNYIYSLLGSGGISQPKQGIVQQLLRWARKVRLKSN